MVVFSVVVRFRLLRLFRISRGFLPIPWLVRIFQFVLDATGSFESVFGWLVWVFLVRLAVFRGPNRMDLDFFVASSGSIVFSGQGHHISSFEIVFFWVVLEVRQALVSRHQHHLSYGWHHSRMSHYDRLVEHRLTNIRNNFRD